MYKRQDCEITVVDDTTDEALTCTVTGESGTVKVTAAVNTAVSYHVYAHTGSGLIADGTNTEIAEPTGTTVADVVAASYILLEIPAGVAGPTDTTAPAGSKTFTLNKPDDAAMVTLRIYSAANRPLRADIDGTAAGAQPGLPVTIHTSGAIATVTFTAALGAPNSEESSIDVTPSNVGNNMTEATVTADFKDKKRTKHTPVSYTHLTLPTILLV